MKSSVFIYPDPFFPLFYINQAKTENESTFLRTGKRFFILYSWMGRVLLLWDRSASQSPQTNLTRQKAVGSHAFTSLAFSRLKKKKKERNSRAITRMEWVRGLALLYLARGNLK